MSILSDRRIRELCENTDKPMISPFVPHQVRETFDIVKQTILATSGSMPGTSNLEYQEDIANVETTTIKKKTVSHGLSSYGYDVTLGNDFKIFTNVNNGVVDPMGIDETCFIDVHKEDNDFVLIPPNSFILAHTKEYFHMPRNVTAIVLGKSTYARIGCSCLATPIEAGWHGVITLEFANTTSLPMKMYAGQGCAQLLFFEGEECEVSYADRGGKYQGQGSDGSGITLPRM